MLKQIFLAVPDGRLLYYDLLVLGAGGTPVCATAARIASHAHAMPPATQPAVTQASPILVGCRVHAGQVHSDEDHRDGGLLAGRVALGRLNCLYLVETSLFDYEDSAKPKHMLRSALILSLSCVGCR